MTSSDAELVDVLGAELPRLQRVACEGTSATTDAAATSTPANSASTTAETIRGDRWWGTLPPDPRGPTYHPQVVWTGTEAIVVGGTDAVRTSPRDEAAAYDPASRTWRLIATPPDQAQRVERLTVWTGAEMLIVGGDDVDASRLVSYGEAYAPTTDTWRTIASPPVGLVSSRSPAAWTGAELLVWPGDGGFASNRVVPTAYDPAADRWRELPEPPVERRQYAASVWTGREWIVWGGRNATAEKGPRELGDGAAYDPATNTWRTIAPAPLAPRRAPGIWTGTEMLVTAGASGGEAVTLNGMLAYADGAAYDPATDRWRPLHDGPGHPGFVPVWTGRQAILFAKAGAWIYDPATDRWTDGCCQSEQINVDGVPVWTGSTVLAFGSTNPRVGGATFTPP